MKPKTNPVDFTASTIIRVELQHHHELPFQYFKPFYDSIAHTCFYKLKGKKKGKNPSTQLATKLE
jgi:hypothetical protein